MTLSGPATLLGLFRYPVKSMIGESLSSADITDKGLYGDRVFAVRDEIRGGIRGGKKLPQLMAFRAVTEEAVRPLARITAPDGETLLSSDADINQWLSRRLEHAVTLWPLLPAEQLAHYRRGAPDSEDFEQELRGIFGRLPEEPLPDLELFAEVLEFESPPGTYFDAFPIHILSQQTLHSISQRAPDHEFDVRRFRPNLLIDLPGTDKPFPEFDLAGQHLRVGECVFEIVGDCPRCSMTTQGFADLPRDTGIMRSLVSEANGSLGCYAKVVETGQLHVGDAITFC